MANRLILNETSYHGKGAIQNIVHEVTSRSFKSPCGNRQRPDQI